MRLDHLLSKENREAKSFSKLQFSERVRLALFNFEGAAEHLEKRKTSARNGGVAQLGEHLLCKQGVRGSIPLISIGMGP